MMFTDIEIEITRGLLRVVQEANNDSELILSDVPWKQPWQNINYNASRIFSCHHLILIHHKM